MLLDDRRRVVERDDGSVDRVGQLRVVLQTVEGEFEEMVPLFAVPAEEAAERDGPARG